MMCFVLIACAAIFLIAETQFSPSAVGQSPKQIITGSVLTRHVMEDCANPVNTSTCSALSDHFFDGTVSVLDYGINVGGGGDDSMAINAALQSACSYTTTNPAAKTCNVVFPEPPSGAYNVCNSSINLPGYWSSVFLRGAGAGVKIRIKPDCGTPPQQVLYQPITAGDSSAARVFIDNLTFDAYCKAPYTFYAGYAVGLTIRRAVFRNANNSIPDSANIYINGGYENDFDFSVRAENVNEPEHVCYNTNNDLPDHNFYTKSSDSKYALVAINARVANYYNASGGNNHYAGAHGWGFTKATAPYALGNLAPQYNFYVIGNADLTNVVMDSPQVAGAFLKGGLDGNGKPTNVSGAIVTNSYVLGPAIGAHGVQFDTGLERAIVVGNGFYNLTSAVYSRDGAIHSSNVIANNGDTSPVASNVIASPIPGGDTAQLSAYSAGNGAILSALSPTKASSLYLIAKGAGSVQMQSNDKTAFAAFAPSDSINFVNTTAAVTGAAPILQSNGKDANIAIQVRGKGNAGLLNSVFIRTFDPTPQDITAGLCADWTNSTNGTTRRYCNVSGKLMSLSYQ